VILKNKLLVVIVFQIKFIQNETTVIENKESQTNILMENKC